MKWPWKKKQEKPDQHCGCRSALLGFIGEQHATLMAKLSAVEQKAVFELNAVRGTQLVVLSEKLDALTRLMDAQKSLCIDRFGKLDEAVQVQSESVEDAVAYHAKAIRGEMEAIRHRKPARRKKGARRGK